MWWRATVKAKQNSGRAVKLGAISLEEVRLKPGKLPKNDPDWERLAWLQGPSNLGWEF